MNKILKKTMVIYLLFTLVSPSVLAQKSKVEELRLARVTYAGSVESLIPAERKAKKEVTRYLLTIGATSGVIGGMYLAREAMYQFSQMKYKKALTSLSSVDLYTAQSKLFAQIPQGEKYMAAQLGEELMPVMQQLFERWKDTYVYEIKSVVVESADRAFQIIPGVEKEVVEKITAMHADFMSKVVFDEKVLLTAGENGIVSYTRSLQKQFEKSVIEEMKAGRSLYSYVNPVRAKAGKTALARAGVGGVKRLGSAGRMVFKKSLPLVAVGLALGIGNARADNAAVLQRIDANPALLLDIDDATFEAVLQSEPLTERAWEVYQTWHRVNALSSSDINALLKAAQESERQAKAYHTQQIQQSLKNLHAH